MTKTKYPRSLAKYIRREKSKIRRNVSTKEERDQQIEELLNRINANRSSHETS